MHTMGGGWGEGGGVGGGGVAAALACGVGGEARPLSGVLRTDTALIPRPSLHPATLSAPT
ncbi:hypothetical protein GCM10020219_034920 [Nonomuraea dietziae]